MPRMVLKLFKNRVGKPMIRLVGGNGEILLSGSGESYASNQKARQTFMLLRTVLRSDEVIFQDETKKEKLCR